MARSSDRTDTSGDLYSKRTMALGQVEVAQRLGFARFTVFGHDRHSFQESHPIETVAALRACLSGSSA
jgi:hypothetical protein